MYILLYFIFLFQIKVLHNKIVKKNVFDGLTGWSTHLEILKTLFFCFFKKQMVSLSRMTCPFGHSKIDIFMGYLSFFKFEEEF
jgi:hypothetical protein